MQCYIWFIATAALWSVAACAGSRPILGPARRGYQEQDTARAFYSYGYSDGNAARAEYTARDGSSRGFYSYVDANGKLQTVKYEAGGRQGFKAEASNLPKPPVDDKKPVTDTAEVQLARQAHLSAIREAQDKERAANLREEAERAQQNEEQPLSSEDADVLERVRAELASMLAERQRGEEEAQNEAANETANQAENRESEREREREQERERSRERARDQEQTRQRDANDLRLRTVYRLADISSSSYLKLSEDLEDRLGSQELRVPVSAYYSYVSPKAKYSVTTPTELRSLRPVALSRSLVLSKRI